MSFEETKEIMDMKRMIFSFSFLLYVAGAYAQITLEECQRKTQDNYPLVHQYGLVDNPFKSTPGSFTGISVTSL